VGAGSIPLARSGFPLPGHAGGRPHGTAQPRLEATDRVRVAHGSAAGRAWVIDPSLQSANGHHLTYVRAIVDQAARRGLETVVLTHRLIEDGLPVGAPVRPVFSMSAYDSTWDGGDGSELRDVLFLNRLFASELASGAGRHEIGPADIVICPHLRQHQLVGLGDWLDGLRRPLPPVLVAMMFGPEFVPAHLRGSPAAGTGLAEDGYRVGFSHLLDVHAGGVQLLVETPSLANTFRRLGAWPVHECYINSPIDGLEGIGDVPAPPPGGRTRIVYVGEARTEKGFHLLPDIVRHVRAACPDVEFGIQLWGPLTATTLRAPSQALTAMAASDPGVELYRRSFDREECLKFQRSADLVLLPYDRDWYRERGSALFQESVAQGRPIVAARGSAQGDIVEAEGIGVVFEEFSAESIGRAVVGAVGDLPRLTATSMAARHRLTVPNIGPFIDGALAARAPVTTAPSFVSVVMCVRNSGRHLPQAIQSILDQTHAEFELCILDDGSTDDTASVVGSFDDPRVRYEWQERVGRERSGECFDRLVAFATADLVAIAEPEDVWSPEKLERQLTVFAEEPATDVCFHDAVTGVAETTRVAWPSSPTRPRWVKPVQFLIGNPVPESTVMFRKDIVRIIGVRGAEPLAGLRFWARAAFNRCRIAALPERLLQFGNGARANTPTLGADRLRAEARRVIGELYEAYEISDVFPEVGFCDDDPVSRVFAHFEIGGALSGVGLISLAARELEAAARIDDTNPDVLNNLGVCLMALGRATDGAALINRAAVFPGCSAALSNASAIRVAGEAVLVFAPWSAAPPLLSRLAGKVPIPARAHPPAPGTVVAVPRGAPLDPAIEMLRRVAASDAVRLPLLVITESWQTTADIAAAYDALGMPESASGNASVVEALQVRPSEFDAVVAAHMASLNPRSWTDAPAPCR